MFTDKLKEMEAMVAQKYNNTSRRLKNHLESEVRIVLERTLKQLFRRVRRFTRKKVADKFMFGCVKDCVDDIFDDLWPEVENEIMYVLRLQFDVIQEYQRPILRPKWCLSYFFSRARAVYLYA